MNITSSSDINFVQGSRYQILFSTSLLSADDYVTWKNCWVYVQIDKGLPFLQDFVDSALANGARPYFNENERLDMDTSGMSSFVSSSRSQQEPSHALRFEAYEVPTVHIPSGSSSAAATPSLLPDFQEPKPESPRSLRNHLAADNSQVDLLGPEITRLRLDGVQKKWGRSSVSSQPSPVAVSDSERRGSGVSEGTSSSKETTPAGQFVRNN